MNLCPLVWVLLTRREPPQRALDIQQHLVVVLVILPLYRFWTRHVTISMTIQSESNTACGRCCTCLRLCMFTCVMHSGDQEDKCDDI